MALLSTVYCTEAELNRFMSSQGVIDFADHDDDNAADTDVVEDAINEATEEIELYCREGYTQAQLSGSELVSRWCVKLAAKFLCQMRFNDIPRSILRSWERLMGEAGRPGILEQIKMNRLDIPGLTRRSAAMRPNWSNLTVDRRYGRSKVRVTQANSSDAPTVLSQDVDAEWWNV